MTVSTYNELQDAVSNWLGRAEFLNTGSDATRTEEWIVNCEARVNRAIQDRNMTTRSTASISTEYAELPASFGGIVRILVQGDPNRPLEYYAPSNFDRKWTTTATGRPINYTIEGDELRLGPTPDQAYTVEILYRKRVVPLSESATSNWLLADNPDIYLYGTLVEAGLYLEYDSNTITPWELRYEEGIKNLKSMGRRERFVNSGPMSRPDFPLF